MGQRLSWRDICRTTDYQGRWLALDNCRYDGAATSPVEADVVDADEDLAALCSRMQRDDGPRCSIVFCGHHDPHEPHDPPASVSHGVPGRPSLPPFRPLSR